jgi:hypothetical protein
MNKIICIIICSTFIVQYSFALPKTNVKDSIIINEASGRNTAVGRSEINRGIEAKGSNIKESVIYSKSKGNVTAVNGSTVNTGIRANDANITKSVLSATSDGNINAIHSNVNTGIDVKGAKNSLLSTNFKGNINAVHSNVRAGTITGNASRQNVITSVGTDINAGGRTVNIGNVHLDNNTFGRNSYKDRHAVATGAQTNVGNVYVGSRSVKSVDTTVGSGAGYGERVKVRHKARVHAATGGVDAAGTKYTYVTKGQRTKAEKAQYGSVGNTYATGRGVRRVKTHVD